jgi:nucleoside-diphosphate-sugar epimerase
VNILVTGSAGFIGKHTVKRLREERHRVIEADRVLGQDMTDRVLADDLVRGADRVIHLASTCSTPGSVMDPLKTFDDTVLTAVAVLDAARYSRIPTIIVSSVKARDGRTPYGAAKVMVEAWATEYASAYQMPVIIVRPGTVYGPGQEGSPESGWIAWFCKAKRENLPVVISGDGSQTRDLLYVGDLTRLFSQMVWEPNHYSGGIWDVGGGVKNAVTVAQMADHLGLEYTFGPPRYGDADSYIGKNDVRGWQPLMGWKEGIRRTM